MIKGNPCPADFFLIYYTPSHFISFTDCKHVYVLTSRVENSVDPDQLAPQKPADLDLHCFQNQIYLDLT